MTVKVSQYSRFLPNDYVGKRIQNIDTVDTANNPNVMGAVCAPANDAFFYYVSPSNGRVRKYTFSTKAVTDLGFGGATIGFLICCSDDGSIIYEMDNNGLIYYWNGSSWISTAQTANAGTKICCNPDGSELYFIAGTGASTILKKWVKATTTVSTIIADPNIYPDGYSMSWVEDGSIWYKVNSGNGVVKKVRISDGVVLLNYTFPTATLIVSLMSRKTTNGFLGYAIANVSSTYYVYKHNNAGDFTQIATLGAPANKLSHVTSPDGKIFVYGQVTTLPTYNIFDFSIQTTPIYSLDLPTNKQNGAFYITNDGNRIFEGFLITNYLYQ